jgi:hypothetical protein
MNNQIRLSHNKLNFKVYIRWNKNNVINN